MYGDDGVSRYPSEMVTGQPVTDQGGTQYILPAGVFRFPLVAAGTYRLEVVPPGNYNSPRSARLPICRRCRTRRSACSRVRSDRTSWSRAAPAVAVDLPLDASNSVLLLRKTAGQQIATTGDFVQYTLTLENTSETGAVTKVDVVDRLPAGARFRPGSLRLNGTRIADPVLAADGSVFTYRQAQLAPRARASRCATWSSSRLRCAA